MSLPSGCCAHASPIPAADYVLTDAITVAVSQSHCCRQGSSPLLADWHYALKRHWRCPQAPGAVAGFYEAEAIAAAKAALQLSPLPADCCRALLALGKAYLALHSLQAGPQASQPAGTAASAAASVTPVPPAVPTVAPTAAPVEAPAAPPTVPTAAPTATPAAAAIAADADGAPATQVRAPCSKYAPSAFKSR